MKKTLLLAGILLSSLSMAQNISFYQVGFKKALIAKGYDTNHDGGISQSEANAITDMDLSNYNPSAVNDQLTYVYYKDLEHFNNLKTLKIERCHSLKTVNIAFLSKLEKIEIEYGSGLVAVYIQQMSKLKSLLLGGASDKLKVVYLYNLPNLEDLGIQGKYTGSADDMNQYNNCPFDKPIDLSQFPQLTYARIAGTNVRKVKVDNHNLTELYLYDNYIQALDITKTFLLQRFKAYDNALKVLNLANSWNSNDTNSADLHTVDVRVNSALSCIQVDKGFYPGTTWKKGNNSSFNGTNSGCACEHPLYIPDTEFEKGLLSDKDEDNNGILCQKEADKITSVSVNSDVENLEGLQHIKNITSFDIGNDKIYELDLSSNKELNTVVINADNIHRLNLRNLSKLKDLFILSATKLEAGGTSYSGNYNTQNFLNTSATNYPELEKIWFFNIKKAELSKTDFSQLPKLKDLYISSEDKSFTSNQHNIQEAKNLERLSLRNTSINNPDLVKDMSNLEVLTIEENNKLSTLDVSQNTKLKDITIESTSITSMDLSHNKDLGKKYAGLLGDLTGEVSLKNNHLSSLNLANGVNYQLTDVDITGNSSLTCVKIDNGFTPPATWKRDSQTAFSTNCGMAVNDVVTQEAFSLYPNPVQDQLYIRTDKNVESVTVYDLNGRRVISQKGAAQINMSALMPGTYIVQILADGKVTSKKVIKK